MRVLVQLQYICWPLNKSINPILILILILLSPAKTIVLNKALENERSEDEDEEEPLGERSQVKGVEEGGLCWMEASCTALELHTADAAVQVSYSVGSLFLLHLLSDTSSRWNPSGIM